MAVDAHSGGGFSCRTNCTSNCYAMCQGGCKRTCENGCVAACGTGCGGTCKNTCKGKCLGLCYNSSFATPIVSGAARPTPKDTTQYYIKYSDLYEVYPHTKTSNKKQWEKDRDANRLYTRHADFAAVLQYYTTLNDKLNDSENKAFELTKEEKKAIEDEYPENESAQTDAKEDLIDEKKEKWKTNHYYDYYKMLHDLCAENASDNPQTAAEKAAIRARLAKLYDQLLKDYDNFVTTDEELDAETLLEYNKTGLMLRYPNMTLDTANDVMARETAYNAYKKIIETKLKNYKKDLVSLDKIEVTMTPSTEKWADEVDVITNGVLQPHEYNALTEVNINRRYKDFGADHYANTSEYQWEADAELESLFSDLFEVGQDFQDKVSGVKGFMEGFEALYDDREYTPEDIADVLADIYNKSELASFKRILNKYDDPQKPEDFDRAKYEQQRDDLLNQREAQRIGFETRAQEIQDQINEYLKYKQNLQDEIDTLQAEIDNYRQAIMDAQTRIDAANSELNKYSDDVIESDNLITYFAENPDIQNNVNILKEYLNWLNNNENNIKRAIASSIGGDASSISDYLQVLKDLILDYSKEAFYFFHYYDSLEEDIDEILEEELENGTVGLNTFKHILFLGDNLINNDYIYLTNSTLNDEDINVNEIGTYDPDEESLYLTSLSQTVEDSNSPAYFAMCEEALRKTLLLLPEHSSNIEDDTLTKHTYKFGIYKYNINSDDEESALTPNFYLMGIDLNDTDANYPIPRWIDATHNAPEWFLDEQNAFINARDEDGRIALLPPNSVGSWMEDITTLGNYRLVPNGTPYNPEQTYYNMDKSQYQFIDNSTWISDIENKRVQWRTAMNVKMFQVFDYTMLYDHLNFNSALQKRADSTASNSIIFIPADSTYPIQPNELKTYYNPLIGNAVYEHNDNLIGSLSRLQILDTQYRAALVNYIYAYISQDNFILTDDNYTAYTNARRVYNEALNSLNIWKAQLTSLQQVYETGWSENIREEDQGKKRQLEELIYAARQQVNYYQEQVDIAYEVLDSQFNNQFSVDSLITTAIEKTYMDYQYASHDLLIEYNTYAKKVNHYLALLFNNKPFGTAIDPEIAHNLPFGEYNLGIGPALNSYKKYLEQQEEGGQDIDFSSLIARIDAFQDKYQRHYELYELVLPGETYQRSKYSYYYKVNESYKPYGEYERDQWNNDIADEKVYKVNKYLEEFNNIIYTLVPIGASYDADKIYYIKNEEENDYDLFVGTEEEWITRKNDKNLYTMSIGENGGILQFLNNLLANSDYVNNIIKIYNDSLALYDSLVQQQLGDTSSYQDLIDAKNRYEQRMRELEEITQYAEYNDIDHEKAYKDILDALTRYLQILTITYVEQVEKRYNVG